jgi:hypothetical protein
MTRPFPFDARGYYYYYRGGRSAAALGGGFSPSAVSPHLWLDPSDLSTLFQTDDTSTPVTADGQTVGRVNDKSGNGFHLTQSTAGSRPLYKTAGGLHWLEFDGVDNYLSTSFDEIAQPFSRVSAFRWLSDVGGQNRFLCGGTSDQAVLFVSAGQISIFAGAAVSGSAASIGTDIVVTELYNTASSAISVDAASSSGDVGPNATSGLTICSTPGGGNYNNSRFYGLTQFDRALTAPEIDQIRTYLAAKQGRVL